MKLLLLHLVSLNINHIPWGAGLKLTIIPADIDTFQINFAAFEAQLNENVSAVLINSPNNPSGIVYSTETIEKLSSILTAKSKEFHHPIYLISDEPYRDIIFEGVDAPYIANYYKNTLTCYSFSKSISLPGERIGYLAVHPDCSDADKIIEICPQISRTIGQMVPLPDTENRSGCLRLHLRFRRV